MGQPARKARDAEPTTVALDSHKPHVKLLWYLEDEDGIISKPKGSEGKTWILLPGLNATVPAKMWDFALTNREWKRWYDRGDITVVEKPPTSWDRHAVASLIERSACVPSITAWHKREKRREVKLALVKKLKDMRKTAPIRDVSGVTGVAGGDDDDGDDDE